MLRHDTAAHRDEWRDGLERGHQEARLGIWWIENDDPEWGVPRGLRSAQPPDGVRPDDARAVRDVGAVEVRRDPLPRTPIALDERCPSRAAGECFDAGGTGAREQIEHIASRQIRLE